MTKTNSDCYLFVLLGTPAATGSQLEQQQQQSDAEGIKALCDQDLGSQIITGHLHSLKYEKSDLLI